MKYAKTGKTNIHIKGTDIFLKVKNISFYEKLLNENFSREKKLFIIRNIATRVNKISIDKIIDKYNLFDIPKCNFCENKSNITFDLKITNNPAEIEFFNFKLVDGNYICTDKKCSAKRSKINKNSFEWIMKSKKVTLEEAKKILFERNKSPFYKTSHNSEEEYKNFQRRDLNYYKNRYGEDKGEEFFRDIRNRVGFGTSRKGLILTHGKEKAEEICRSRAVTFNHFKNKFNCSEDEAKQKYIEYISKCTRVGTYINSKKIDSKQAYNFFIKLTKILIQDKIILSENDVIFSDGNNNEKIIYYTNSENKLRFFKLDYFIKSQNISIEFNGG